MKQGQASRSGPGCQKTEPVPQAINPGYAGNIGSHFGNHAECGDFTPRITPEDAGRGYRAPGIGSTSHKGGSQGKY